MYHHGAESSPARPQYKKNIAMRTTITYNNMWCDDTTNVYHHGTHYNQQINLYCNQYDLLKMYPSILAMTAREKCKFCIAVGVNYINTKQRDIIAKYLNLSDCRRLLDRNTILNIKLIPAK